MAAIAAGSIGVVAAWSRYTIVSTSLGGAAAGGRARQRREPGAVATSALAPLDLVGDLGQDGVQVAHHSEVDQIEDRCLWVFVHGHDRLGGLHAGPVLDRSRDAVGDI